jgi:LmbE family N-acetylglucosaminyl deacetylase
VSTARDGVDILCVIAHPDDELLCAGLVAHHSRHGRSVLIAVVTHGAGGRACYDPQMPPAQLAEVRRQEMMNSAKVLGASKVEFLGFADSYNTPLADDLAIVTARIRGVIQNLRPAIVLTHGPDGEYGHPNHKDVSRCTTEAIQSLDPAAAPLLYYCNAYFSDAPNSRCNRSVTANYIFPVHGRNYEIRRQVMLSHVSQMDCFIGFFGRDANRECYHRVGEPNADSAWFEVVLD